MENINNHLVEQGQTAARFIDTLLSATRRIAVNRGETMEDIMTPGWSRTFATEEEGYDTSEYISLVAKYDIDQYGEHGFIYQMTRSIDAMRDLKECTVDEMLEIYQILADPNNEFVTTEQRDGLAQLMTAYVADKLDSETRITTRRELRLVCKGYESTGSLTIERSMALYVDDTLVTSTAVGDVDVYESMLFPDGDQEDDEPGDILTLPEDVEHDIDLSTPTCEDIAELTGMLQMLGLVDRPAGVKR